MTHQFARATRVRVRRDTDAVAISTVVLLACAAPPVGKLRMIVDAADATDEDCAWEAVNCVETLEAVVVAAVPVATGTESVMEAGTDEERTPDDERDAEPILCDCAEEVGTAGAVIVTTTVLSTTEVESTTDVDSGAEALALSEVDEAEIAAEDAGNDSVAEVVESGRPTDPCPFDEDGSTDEVDSADEVVENDSAIDVDAVESELAAVEVTATDVEVFVPVDDPPPTDPFPKLGVGTNVEFGLGGGWPGGYESWKMSF